MLFQVVNIHPGASEAAKRRRMYPKIMPYIIPTPTGVENRWFPQEDLMDPREVASPACRVGRPNIDRSIGETRGTPCLPNAQQVGNIFTRKES